MLEYLARFNDRLEREFPTVQFCVRFQPLQIVLECTWIECGRKYIAAQAVGRFVPEAAMGFVVDQTLTRLIRSLNHHFNPQPIAPNTREA